VAVAGTALLLALVGLASRPDAGSGPAPLGEEPVQVAIDAVAYLLTAAVAGGLAIIAWVFWPRRGEDLPSLPPRRRHALLATAVTVAMSVVLAVWVRALAGGPAGGLARGGAAAPGAPPLPAVALRRAAGGGPDWIALAVALAAVAAVAGLAWWALRAPRPRPSRRLAASLRRVLDDAIEDVLGEADPRRAVVAAWARLERVLSAHGLPRRESEAPFEYAARAGAELDGEALPLERLAALFEWARFSLNDVTPAMREEALTGLRTVRDGLRVDA
jgi:hypothetical protein